MCYFYGSGQGFLVWNRIVCIKISNKLFIPVFYITLSSTMYFPKQNKKCKILLDSGASESVDHISQEQKVTNWQTMAGKVLATARGHLNIKSPELSSSAKFRTLCHATDQNSYYRVILGWDFLSRTKSA